MVPIFKKDDVKNYRPITILNAVDKVFQQLLRKQVTENLTAYRRKHSCETTLLWLVEEWKKAVDAKKEVAVLSTDMSKAFESLDPPLMLIKLRAYGFMGHALKLLRLYFTERKNRVRLEMETTSEKDVNRGFPQGSTFGPLLWNIFQNDLKFNVCNCPLWLYADDH